METTAAILEKAQQRAQELGLPYKGALLPMEAYAQPTMLAKKVA